MKCEKEIEIVQQIEQGKRRDWLIKKKEGFSRENKIMILVKKMDEWFCKNEREK